MAAETWKYDYLWLKDLCTVSLLAEEGFCSQVHTLSCETAWHMHVNIVNMVFYIEKKNCLNR